MSELPKEIRDTIERKLREAGQIGLNCAADLVNAHADQEDDAERRVRLRTLALQIRAIGSPIQ